MIIPVGIREFKSRLSHYLAKAREGQTIEITSHRKVIARVTGLPEEPAWAKHHPGMWRMVQSGQATWNGGRPKFARIKLPDGGKTVSDMVLEDRG
jgi:prevent-host-death family protein